MFSKISNLTSAGCTCYWLRKKKKEKAIHLFVWNITCSNSLESIIKDITFCKYLFIIISSFAKTGKCRRQWTVCRSALCINSKKKLIQKRQQNLFKLCSVCQEVVRAFPWLKGTGDLPSAPDGHMQSNAHHMLDRSQPCCSWTCSCIFPAPALIPLCKPILHGSMQLLSQQ